MYEILAGMDAFVTDYSSACFEAGFTYMPVFIFADDIKQYVKDRGSLFWNLATDPLNHVTCNREMFPNLDLVFPFSIATDNAELEKNIFEFDMVKYNKNLERFHENIKLVFDGKSSKNLANVIEKNLEGKDEK